MSIQKFRFSEIIFLIFRNKYVTVMAKESDVVSIVSENIKKYRVDCDMTQSDLAKLVGKAPSVIANWEAGTNRPDVDSIQKMLNVFNIDANTFFDWQSPDNKKSALSDDRTLEFATKFIKLDKHGREIVEFVINNEAERMKSEAEDATDIISATLPMWTINDLETITLPLLLQSRSAGNGDFADDESAEDKAVHLSDITRRADYLIKVNGESMEPDYPDGCIVAVRLQEDVKLGEVGVFVSSGDSYIKRRGIDSLESINTKCPDVIPTDGTVCRGLVLGVVE